MGTIREVSISNFRGINFLKWFPNEGINCLIGPGDGCKSTILDAIELAIGTKQSVIFTDADFHRCDVTKPIIIDITLGKLDDELLNLEAYGHFLRGRDVTTGQLYNETAATLETVLTVRLIVYADLEPQWILYCEGAAAEGRERNLQWKHRQKIAPTRLGVVADHHMSLGPRSILGKISADRAQASAALASAARQARKAFADEGCEGVADILSTSHRIANEMGISVDTVSALLDVKGVTFSGGAIALHETDNIPMKNLGSGSMRLLVAGLQKSVGVSSISIIDELEFGLEPYRIVRLLDVLGAKSNDLTQQVFMTTHSPIVLRELSSVQLCVVRANKIKIPAVMIGEEVQTPAQTLTENHIYPLGNSEAAQKTLRACAEAFLAPSVIVCEGKTEIGILRGMDLYLQGQSQRSMLSYGCHWADGNGSSMIERASIFAAMGYRTCLFMDSDVVFPPQTYQYLNNARIQVFQWNNGLSTEGAIFASVSSDQILPLLNIACERKSESSVNDKIVSMSGGRYNLEMCSTAFLDDMRTVLGQCAGDGKWFKDIAPAEEVARNIILPHWASTNVLVTNVLTDLLNWIRPVLQATTAQAPQS